MKIVFVVISVITGFLLLSTMICGLWIKANNIKDASSLNFHMNIGIASVIFGVVSVVTGIILVLKK